MCAGYGSEYAKYHRAIIAFIAKIAPAEKKLFRPSVFFGWFVFRARVYNER